MNGKKVWKNEVEKEHNYIIFKDDTLYTLKTKPKNYLDIKAELEQGIINEKFFSLPVSYLTSAEFRIDDTCIRLYHGKDTEDEIVISNNTLREEVFEYLKLNTEYIDFKKHKPSIITRIKRPLIALCLVLGIFIYVLAIMHSLNEGAEFELRGNRPGLGTIVLGLANLGLTTNLAIFIPLFSIAGFKFYKNLKNKSEIHQIIYRGK